MLYCKIAAASPTHRAAKTWFVFCDNDGKTLHGKMSISMRRIFFTVVYLFAMTHTLGQPLPK
jgi:hypothetical protein